MNDQQIKHMVNRFLGWKLPADFSPDAGISFKAEFNEHTDHPMKHEPSGTNLLDASQAEAMIRYLLEGLPPEKHVTGGNITLREAALALLDARKNGLAHIGYRLDLWRDLEAALATTEGKDNG